MQRRTLFIALLVGLLISVPHATYAATLSLTPGSQKVTAGNIATLRISVSAGGTSINNAEAVLDFPTDLLQVVSVSKGSSVFSLWVEDPSYSNNAGTISFNGGVPNPGYTGSGGTVVTITFLTKKTGTASVKLRDAAVRANDGFGTDVLSDTNNAQITISDPAVIQPVPPTTTATPGQQTTTAIGPSDKILITSSTHPDQNAWYSNRNPLLTWKLPKDTIAIQTLVSQDSPETPTVTYKPGIVEKQIDTLTDGSWYFSLRSRVSATWGPMSTYRIQIDGTPPVLGVPVADYDASARILTVSNIGASDVTSGINLYEFSIDGGATTTVSARDISSATSYRLPYKGTTGNHRLMLAVADMAGNKTFAVASFTIVLPLGDQVVWTLFGIGITLFWFLLIVLLVSLTALFVALTALYRTFTQRPTHAVQVGKRDQTLHRALTLFKQDMERHIKNLTNVSATRVLTSEEQGIQESLAGNVDDLERFLKKEIKKFD